MCWAKGPRPELGTHNDIVPHPTELAVASEARSAQFHQFFEWLGLPLRLLLAHTNEPWSLEMGPRGGGDALQNTRDPFPVPSLAAKPKPRFEHGSVCVSLGDVVDCVSGGFSGIIDGLGIADDLFSIAAEEVVAILVGERQI